MKPRALALALSLLAPASALAVDQASTYPGCATRSVSVPWGGSVAIDLKDCHSFGLGAVSRPPAHGTASPGDRQPLDGYRYTHGGVAPAGGGRDRFVVLDDNSDTITVIVDIQAPSSAITIGPAALPALRAGQPLQLALAAGGGQAPYTFRLASGALPPGLALASDGRLSGTPTAREPYAFDVTVADAAGGTVRRSFGGDVAPAPMTLAPASATATQGQPFTLALRARGGVAPHRFQVEGPPGLPDGLQLGSDGVIRGIPRVKPGRYPLTLRVTDASTGPGQHFELERLSLVVVAAKPAGE